MLSVLRKTVLVTLPAALLAPALALAAGGKAVEAIVFVADSRRFTGWRAWSTNLYNENLLHFTLLTVVIIPLTAVILGSISSYFLASLGINLKSRVLAEH